MVYMKLDEWNKVMYVLIKYMFLMRSTFTGNCNEDFLSNWKMYRCRISKLEIVLGGPERAYPASRMTISLQDLTFYGYET